MRWKVDLFHHKRYTKLIIYEAEKGLCYLFKIVDEEEGYDDWFATVAEAQASAQAQFGILAAQWLEIPDPLPGAQHDQEVPTVVLRGDDGQIETVSYDEALQRGWQPPR